MNQRALILLSIVLVVIAVGLGAYIVSTNQSTLNTSATGGGTPASCPSGTGMLFTGTSLTVGTDVNFGGKITQASGSWRMDNQNGVPMAIYGTSMKVEFANDVYMDTVLIFDNDPKSGENPWSINGRSLPTTGQDQWGPPFKLDITSKTMTFDYGGDSPHFNICISQPKPTNSPTPTAKPSHSPTPKPSNSPTPSPSKTPTPTPTPIGCSTCTTSNPYLCTSKTNSSIITCKQSGDVSGYTCKNCFPTTPTHTPTPTPTLCVTPKAVTDLKISCPLCQ